MDKSIKVSLIMSIVAVIVIGFIYAITNGNLFINGVSLFSSIVAIICVNLMGDKDKKKEKK